MAFGRSDGEANRAMMAIDSDQKPPMEMPTSALPIRNTVILVAAIEVNVPELVVARTAIGDFQPMICSKTAEKLNGRLETAKKSLVGSFASGVEKDIAAVRNAIVSPWSNGQTEGQITRLKLIKREMYGRAGLDLLQARLIGAT